MIRFVVNQSLFLSNYLKYNFARLSSRGNTKKQKQYFNKTIKQQQFEKHAQSFMNDAFQEYKQQAKRDSIIKDFRRDIFNIDSTPQSILQSDKFYDQQTRKIQRELNNAQKNPQRVKKFSKKLMEKFMNKQQVVKNKDLFRDQKDYSVYDSNYTKLGDRRLGDREMLTKGKSIERGYNFIEKLPDDYQQKRRVNQYLTQSDHKTHYDKTVSQFGRKGQQIMDFARILRDQRIQKGVHVKDQTQHRFLDPQDANTPYHDWNAMFTEKLNPSKPPTMSPQAISKMYQLYLQGWSIRDICRRYGILPQRAKFHIWCRAQLQHQVLPKTGIKTFLMNSIRQQQYSEQCGGYMDYGIDIPQMQRSQKISQITSWQTQTVDVHRKPHQYTQALQKIQKMNKWSRYQMVQIGTHGKQGKRYILKQLNVFKGKGSNDFHLRKVTFKKLMKEKKKMLYTYY